MTIEDLDRATNKVIVRIEQLQDLQERMEISLLGKLRAIYRDFYKECDESQIFNLSVYFMLALICGGIILGVLGSVVVYSFM